MRTLECFVTGFAFVCVVCPQQALDLLCRASVNLHALLALASGRDWARHITG